MMAATEERPGSCAGCGVSLVWRVGPKGTWLPLERVAVAYTLGDDFKVNLIEGPLYISHFVSCPARDRFSNRRRR